MKIASSALHLQAQHSASRLHARSERLEMWVGPRPAAGPARPAEPEQPPQHRISGAARQAASVPQPPARTQGAREIRRTEEDAHLTPRLAMVRDLIERLTGVPALLTVLPSGQPAPTDGAALPASAPAAPAGGAGFGLVHEVHEVREESEQTRFSAEGVVRTRDGQEIRFSLQLEMQRHHREESWTSLRLGDAAVPVDPLVINFDGTAAQLQELRFAFDLDGDGQGEAVPLLAGGRGYLALDRNQNQRIDNGLELFGPATSDGFAELAAHDGDGNGWIDESDAVFRQLRVWVPSADGTGSLRTLQETGVGAIHLGAVDTPFALRAADNSPLGAVRATSAYLREDGGAGTVQQIDLAV
ncbi:hypothetical protein [Simplicispira lacusdiani]|uniref:hypothetical protein n=1 Tax=Simplicispira lacusdiani TaxID=2213010 RepID=UPI000E708431|nr:hypothetical protein [Simplicispira lacusdiani]